MHINQVWAAYFSGTDTTKTIVTTIAQEIAQALGVPCAELNFTPPQAREEHYTFAPTDLVICRPGAQCPPPLPVPRVHR